MPTPTLGRRVLAIALVAYVSLLALALLAPTSSAQSEGASWLVDLGRALGLPAHLCTQERAEFLANALILVPVSALGSLLWPRTTWRDWTAFSFVAAGAVEIVQGLLLPDRTAAYVDVVANTLGGLGGALVVLGWRALTRPRTAGGTRPRPPEAP